MYVDPDGEWVHIVIGAVVGGVINLGIKAYQGKINSWGDGFMAFGIGAAAGAIGAATGGAAFAAAGGAAGGAGGFLAGATGGAMGSAFSLPVLSMGNTAYFGDPMMTPQQYLMGIAGGALLGGTVNGITALANGRNFMTGNLPTQAAPTVTPTPTPAQTQQPKPNNELSLRQEVQTAVPDNQPAIYKESYLQKVSGIDGQHSWNSHTVEIVVDNGQIFPGIGVDKQSILVQQVGKHHGIDGVFELIIKNGAITHQRFIPGGIITGTPNQIIPNIPGSVSPVKPWW